MADTFRVRVNLPRIAANLSAAEGRPVTITEVSDLDLLDKSEIAETQPID